MDRKPRRFRIILIVLILVALGLMAVSSRQPAPNAWTRTRDGASSALGGLEKSVSGFVGSIGDAIGSLGSENQGKVGRLTEQNEALKQQLVLRDQENKQGTELAKLYHISQVGQYKIVAGKVIAYSAAKPFEQTVTIDIGTANGVATDMTVICGDGLVGRVISAGKSTSTVLLARDKQSFVGFLVDRTGLSGVVQGDGTGTAFTATVPDHPGAFKAGDRLVTAGSKLEDYKPYVPGVPIGEVIKADSAPGSISTSGEIKPFVNFDTLSLVGVVVAPPAQNPGTAVLPPKPSDSPASAPSGSPSTPGSPTTPSSPSPTGSATPTP